jgi:hypothetical protein
MSEALADCFRRWIVDTDATLDRWNPARHPMASSVLFWFRTSPREMEPNRESTTVSSTDPPLVLTDQSLVILDTKGRLVEFRQVPPQRDPSTTPAPEPTWDAVFRAVGVDERAFTRVTPEWSPKDFADARAAWEGPLPDAADLRLRIEAAAYRGRIVSVFAVAPWARPRAMVPPPPPSWVERIRSALSVAFLLSVLIGAAVVAHHNLRVNRADRRGAARLATAYVIIQIVAWLVSGHHRSGARDEINNFLRIAGPLALQAGILWMLYLALEPYGRRFWPDGLLGWTRLLSGRIRDPRIGREMLIGSALGGGLMLIDLFRTLSPLLAGRPPGDLTLGTEVEVFDGFGRLYGSWADQFYISLQAALIFVMVLVIARVLLRRTWLAVVVAMTIELTVVGGGVSHGGIGWLYYLSQLMALGLITFAILRYGLLVTALTIIIDNIPSTVPIVPQGASWATLPGTLSLLLVVAVAGFGFYAARAGQPLFGKLEV